MSIPQPSISVIIPVYNSTKTIRYTLAALKNQIFSADEIIIGYNPSKDETLAIIEEYSKILNIKIIKFEKVVGPAEARNICAAQTQSEWLAFVDSDCAPFENWLEKIKELTIKINADCYTGPVIGYLPESVFDKYQNAFGLNIVAEDKLFNRYEIFKSFGHTANFIVKRKIFEKLQGFNPQLFYAEDHDFCARLLLSNNNYTLYFSNELVMRHIFRTDLKKFLHFVFFYNYAYIYLIRKYYKRFIIKFGNRIIVDFQTTKMPMLININNLSLKLIILVLLCIAISKLMIIPLILYLLKINTKLFLKFNKLSLCENYGQSYKFLLIYLLEEIIGTTGHLCGLLFNRKK